MAAPFPLPSSETRKVMSHSGARRRTVARSSSLKLRGEERRGGSKRRIEREDKMKYSTVPSTPTVVFRCSRRRLIRIRLASVARAAPHRRAEREETALHTRRTTRASTASHFNPNSVRIFCVFSRPPSRLEGEEKSQRSEVRDMNLVSKASGVSSASDVRPPNSSWFSVSLTSRRRTISPRYMPLIIFSKLQEEDEHRKRQKHICEAPSSPKPPHSVLMHMRPSSPSTRLTFLISSM
ncbi:hypothetical protein EYF80_033558 [Liparis tanakae]|uniref:Uncharacterized protein n=1 Tax=Liparis tanakae TaxID=230148 RepID=A0A4Z2GTY1_9TELE|nr:hypothetical protein EYF80_033558 [Liparis tanakae]